jgi:hypothetical protein
MRRALLVGVILVLVAVLALLMWRAQTPGEAAGSPTDFNQENVAAVSADLEVELIRVAGEVAGGVTRWRCLMRCREADGCHARIRVNVDYRSGSESRSLSFVAAIGADPGEEMAVVGFQRPPGVVDKVERVELLVEQRLSPDQPTPAPFM